MDNKGFYSFDLFFSSIFILILLIVFAAFFLQQNSSQAKFLSQIDFQRKAMSYTDYIVKKELAVTELNRLIPNKISSIELVGFKPQSFDSFFMKSLSLSNTVYFSNDEIGKNCLEISRFVLIEELSSNEILKVVYCER